GGCRQFGAGGADDLGGGPGASGGQVVGDQAGVVPQRGAGGLAVVPLLLEDSGATGDLPAQVGWDLAGPPERQAALASGPDGTGSDGCGRRVERGAGPLEVLVGPAGGLECRQSLTERRRPHRLSVLLGRTIDRVSQEGLTVDLVLKCCIATVACIGGGCAHDSTLRVLLAASLLVPGLTRTAGDSRLSRGLVPILRSDLTLRTRRGDLALRGRRCRVLGIAQQLLARRGRLRASTGLTHTQTALARIDQRV